MQKDNSIFLEHIMEAITNIEDYTRGFSQEDFIANRQAADAVIRNLEIIGEAVKNLTEDFKIASVHIPWRDIADLRNVLIHEYFGVDKEKVWLMIKNDIPELKNEIDFLLKI